MNGLDTAAQVIARFDLAGEIITHLKLQKLLYYIKGWAMAIPDEFQCDYHLEAWKFGPVENNVYKKYRSANHNPITISWDEDNQINKNILIDSVVQFYGTYDPFQLVGQTHRETPWVNNRPSPGHEFREIPDNEIQAYFDGPARNEYIHQKFIEHFLIKKHDVIEVYGEFERLGIQHISEEEALKLIERP